jgi:hypothetical protein
VTKRTDDRRGDSTLSLVITTESDAKSIIEDVSAYDAIVELPATCIRRSSSVGSTLDNRAKQDHGNEKDRMKSPRLYSSKDSDL